MRLPRPLYETLPSAYALIGAGGVWIAHLDAGGPRSRVAFVIGVLAEIAALTIFLHRYDHRAFAREYNHETIELPSRLED